MKLSNCYFFGTFNPIHFGHLYMANHAIALCGKSSEFEQVTFIPAGNPPHRSATISGPSALLPVEDRYQLLVQALYDQPALNANPIEVELSVHGQKTYTIETLRKLHPVWPERRIPMLMGQDAFESLAGWREADTLVEKCHFIVLQRGKILLNAPDVLSNLSWEALQVDEIDISATTIRNICVTSASKEEMQNALATLIPPKAFVYFMDRELYKVFL